MDNGKTPQINTSPKYKKWEIKSASEKVFNN